VSAVALDVPPEFDEPPPVGTTSSRRPPTVPATAAGSIVIEAELEVGCGESAVAKLECPSVSDRLAPTTGGAMTTASAAGIDSDAPTSDCDNEGEGDDDGEGDAPGTPDLRGTGSVGLAVGSISTTIGLT